MRIVMAITALIVASSFATAAFAEVSSERGSTPVIMSEPYSYTPPEVDNPTNVALFRDVLPWGSNADDQVLINNGIAFTVYGSGSIGSVDLSSFDKVIISNQQDANFNATVQANTAWFDAYVRAGGCLLYGLAHYFGDLALGVPGPGGYSLAVEIGNDLVTVAAPAHPLFNTPNIVPAAALQNWNYSSHGDLGVPGGNTTLLRNNELSFGPAVGEVMLGLGYVVATTQPYQWIAADPGYVENLVLYQPCEGQVPVEPSSWGAIKGLFE